MVLVWRITDDLPNLPTFPPPKFPSICKLAICNDIFVCSFVDENNTKFNGATILTINGENVSAINSPKVPITL